MQAEELARVEAGDKAKGRLEDLAESLVENRIENRAESWIERKSLDFFHDGVRYRFVRWCNVAGDGSVAAAGGVVVDGVVAGEGGHVTGSALVDGTADGGESLLANRFGSARPIVLLHGFAQSALSWENVASRLAQRCCAYALDFVGHGESERPYDQAFYEMGAVCEMLLAFLRFVQREHGGLAPAVVGYSMGGRLALAAASHASHALAASAPASSSSSASPSSASSAIAGSSDAFAPSSVPFAALVLESAGLGPVSFEEREAFACRNGENARRVRKEGVAKFMDEWERLPLFATQRALPENVRLRVREQRLSNDSLALARTFLGLGAQCMPDRAQALATLVNLREGGVAVHYLAGEFDKKYTGMAKMLGREHAEVHIVPRAGHNVHLERPEAFLQILERILSD